MGNADLLCCNRFQSTLPMRGATLHNRHCQCNHSYFNPHSPCGERLAVLLSCTYHTIISIHTPHAGSDRNDRYSHICKHGFQSTLPMRGATRLWVEKCQSCLISIHTPHAGSDSKIMDAYKGRYIFQSTLPMRGATIPFTFFGHSSRFQSTLPMRGATCEKNDIGGKETISIHTPHAGSDADKTLFTKDKDGFQSTLPMRGATCMFPLTTSMLAFQSTLPMRGATVVGKNLVLGIVISIHTPHAGERPLSM